MSVRARTVRKAMLVLVAALVVVFIAAMAWVKLAPRRVPAGQPPLVTLGSGSLPSFRDAFNAADGEIRVLVLLSPT